MKSKKIIVLIVSLVIIFLIVALLYIILYNNNRIMSNNTPIESSKFNSQTDNQVHDTNKNMTIVDISQSNNSTNTVVNLNDKRNLTDEELEGIRQMLTTYGVFSSSSWNGYPSFYADSLYLMVVKENFDLKRLVLDEIPYTYDKIVDIYCKYHNLTTSPMAGSGKLCYCTLNDIQRMYRLVFDVDITKETLIANIKKEGACYDEKEQLLIISTGFWGESSFDIVSSYYSNNNYYLELSENNINIGTVVFKKVDDRYCYVSYEANNAEKLDINSELVQQLCEYIPSTSGIWGFVDGKWNSEDYSSNVKSYMDAYRSEKVTIGNIDNKVILARGFSNKGTLLVQGKNAFLDPTASSPTDSILNPSGEGPWYYFTLELMEKTVKRIYGKNATITHEEFEFFGGVYGCSIEKYNNIDMYHYSFGGGGGPYHETNVQELVSAVKVNNEIYLYDRNLYLVQDAANGNKEESGYNFDFYDCCEKNNLVKHFFVSYDEFTTNTRENLIEMVKDVMKSYKHTFKQAEDGTYYWYSTEPIE